MNLEPFESSRLKLSRAEFHIENLRSEIEAYLIEKSVAIIATELPKYAGLRSISWIAKVKKPPPSSLSGIIGDAVHNIRASLDLMACDLVRLNGKSADSVYFPFAADANGMDRAIKDRNFHRASAAAVDLLRTLKPYRGGNAALRGIHDLDIADKHKAIIPALSAVEIAPFRLQLGAGVNNIAPWRTTISKDGQEIMTMPAASNVPLGTELAATFTFVLGLGVPFAGYEVIPLIDSLFQNVSSVVQAFASLCQGQTFPIGRTIR